MALENIHLVIFLSRATTLDRWNQAGMLERELNYYRRMAGKIGRISLVTSGGLEELKFEEQLGNICLLTNKWGFSPNVYSLAAPFLHWKALRTADVYKTNQLDGAWTAVIAGKIHQKPVLVRAGYLWAEFIQQAGNQGLKSRVIRILQNFSLKLANMIIVTTPVMEQSLKAEYHIPREKIRVVPNHVDTEIFKPDNDKNISAGRICYVGRLVPQKNLASLILALEKIPDCHLVVIGAGKMRLELETLANTHQVKIEFSGIRENHQLPHEYNISEIFILPSLYEGHPKALVEAMACGKPVIGTNVAGIRELIQTGETGLLCEPDVESIRKSVKDLLSDQEYQDFLGKNARQFVVENFSIQKILGLELDAISSSISSYDRAN
jgi:glycosyltransferase involved in cell wall biosynthesis